VGDYLIRHIRYEDFFAVVSDGADTLQQSKDQVDRFVRDMGDLKHHHVLLDLRHATTGPVAEPVLVEIAHHMKRQGLGVVNRLALLIDRDDEKRAELGHVFVRITTLMGMHVALFTSHQEALDWLNETTEWT
jgi:hypothetical protein